MFEDFTSFVKKTFKTDDFIPLHAPVFFGNEKRYLNDCIDSTFVSSVGEYVTQFEKSIAAFTGAKHAIATVNGTAALHIALKLAGVSLGDEVITQPLTFIATANAINYLNAYPIFIDVDLKTMSLSPDKLDFFLKNNTYIKNNACYNRTTNRRIKAVVPMHTFGFSGNIDEIVKICNNYFINVVEDAAESLGSYYKGKHTGTYGLLGTLSFNGNKTITTGGGGMILTNNDKIARIAKHITTTAKIPHKWEFEHDQVAYNYRLPNINAALGCAQLENIDIILDRKKWLSNKYNLFFQSSRIKYCAAPLNSSSNYWLNAVLLKDLEERNKFLEFTNDKHIMTRPIWRLMNKLSMFKNAQVGNLDNSLWLEERVVNIPSSVILKD